jgi:ATP-dependent Clp protease adaptor protein ClpS
MAAPQTVPVEVPDVTDVPDLDKAWVTIVWNDPVNLMSYVTWVFQKLFGYSREKAEQLMLDVHHQRRARADGVRRDPTARIRPVGHGGPALTP